MSPEPGVFAVLAVSGLLVGAIVLGGDGETKTQTSEPTEQQAQARPNSGVSGQDNSSGGGSVGSGKRGASNDCMTGEFWRDMFSSSAECAAATKPASNDVPELRGPFANLIHSMDSVRE